MSGTRTRRAIMVLAACVFGLVVAFGFAFVADILRPCSGEGLMCSMTKVIGFVYIPVFSVIALIALSVAAFWKANVQSLNVAALVPLALFLLLMAYIKWSEFSVREYSDIRERDVQEFLQIIIPIVLTLIVPWIVLRRFAGRAETEKNVHG